MNAEKNQTPQLVPHSRERRERDNFRAQTVKPYAT
jgi:hypothetical protein